jgi:F-type H+-transporting ATPase subunit a
MTTRTKVALGFGLYLFTIIVVVIATGWSRQDNTEFKPQNEFKLDTLFSIGPWHVNKAHLYILAAAALMCWSMIYIARRMQQRPNRVQTAVEVLFGLMRDNITRGNMSDEMAARWFPFVGSLFLFIWFSNLIGYIPLPTNIEHKVDILGVQVPAFALYAATANLSVPLALALVVFIAYNTVGIARKGLIGYLKSFIPEGVPHAMRPFIFALEFASNFMRLISLSVRLFANILAGHLIILFMAGALAVILGIAGLGIITLPFAIVLFLFEVGLVATLQAFIFATLTAIYLGGAASESH